MKKLTQKELNFINNYKNKGLDDFSHLYKKPSYFKIEAVDKILKDYINCDGWDLRFLKGNCMSFSAAFEFEKDGNIYLRYFTKDNTYDIKLGKITTKSILTEAQKNNPELILSIEPQHTIENPREIRIDFYNNDNEYCGTEIYGKNGKFLDEWSV